MDSTERTVLVVEDNVVLAGCLERMLPRLQPWRVTARHSAEDALAWLQVETTDAAIVDLGLPGMAGYQLCLQMRAFFRGPILVLSVEDRENRKQRALASGADGFLAKPATPGAIASRLRALMALSERYAVPTRLPDELRVPHREDELAIGALRLARATRNLLVRGGVSSGLQLSPAEAGLLEAFARVPGRLVCRDDLHEVVSSRPWDGRSTLIDFHLHGLRKKLELLGGPFAHGVEIRSVYGEGYTLIVWRPGTDPDQAPLG